MTSLRQATSLLDGSRLRRVAHRPPDSQAHDPEQRSDLQDREDILHPGARAHAENIDDAQQQQSEDGN